MQGCMPECEVAYNSFIEGKWQSEINVRDFIQKNYTPYYGDSEFLADPTRATFDLWNECKELFEKERQNGGVLDMDTEIVSDITSHKSGYINKELEKIVGLAFKTCYAAIWRYKNGSDFLQIIRI